MAKKIKYTPQTNQGVKMAEVDAYQEGPLAVFKDGDKGWTVALIAAGGRITKSVYWKEKRQALAYAQAILAYSEPDFSIDWNFLTVDEMYEKNDKQFLERAYAAAMAKV